MAYYLVTGVAGFTAPRVAEMPLEQGRAVVGVDNLNYYYDVRLKDYRLSGLLDKCHSFSADPRRSVFAGDSSANNEEPLTNNLGTFRFRYLDIEHFDALERLFREHLFEAVLNLAARAGVRSSMENPHVYLSTNTLGTLNILECMRKYGVKKFGLAFAGFPAPLRETSKAVAQPLPVQ